MVVLSEWMAKTCYSTVCLRWKSELRLMTFTSLLIASRFGLFDIGLATLFDDEDCLKILFYEAFVIVF